jgi:hypothetical protein
VSIEVADEKALSGLESVSQALRAPFPRDGLKLILRAARTRAPVVTGHLRSTGALGQEGVVFSAPYAGPIHWGWRARNIKPNPFLIRGAEATVDEWIAIYQDELTAGFGE